MQGFFILTLLLSMIATPIMFFTHKQQRKYVLLTGLSTLVISFFGFAAVTPAPPKTAARPVDKPAIVATPTAVAVVPSKPAAPAIAPPAPPAPTAAETARISAKGAANAAATASLIPSDSPQSADNTNADGSDNNDLDDGLDHCDATNCPTGSTVLAAPKYIRAYACPTFALAFYTDSVLQAIYSPGSPPKLIPATGEPMIGDDAHFFDEIRRDAKVKNLTQAIAQCHALKANQLYKVIPGGKEEKGVLHVMAKNSDQVQWINNNDLEPIDKPAPEPKARPEKIIVHDTVYIDDRHHHHGWSLFGHSHHDYHHHSFFH